MTETPLKAPVEPGMAPLAIIQYRLAGWDEDNRVWVYDLYVEDQ